MNAVISGALGVAVLADDQTCKILWDESPDEIQVIPTEEAARLVRRAETRWSCPMLPLKKSQTHWHLRRTWPRLSAWPSTS